MRGSPTSGLLEQIFNRYSAERLIREADLELPQDNVFARQATDDRAIAVFVTMALEVLLEEAGYPFCPQSTEDGLRILAYLVAELRRRGD